MMTRDMAERLLRRAEADAENASLSVAYARHTVRGMAGAADAAGNEQARQARNHLAEAEKREAWALEQVRIATADVAAAVGQE